MSETTRRAGMAKIELRETEAAFVAVRDAMIGALVSTSPANTGQMQALVCGVQALDAVRDALRFVINAGTIEEAGEAIQAHFKTTE